MRIVNDSSQDVVTWVHAMVPTKRAPEGARGVVANTEMLWARGAQMGDLTRVWVRAELAPGRRLDIQPGQLVTKDVEDRAGLIHLPPKLAFRSLPHKSWVDLQYVGVDESAGADDVVTYRLFGADEDLAVTVWVSMGRGANTHQVTALAIAKPGLPGKRYDLAFRSTGGPYPFGCLSMHGSQKGNLLGGRAMPIRGLFACDSTDLGCSQDELTGVVVTAVGLQEIRAGGFGPWDSDYRTALPAGERPGNKNHGRVPLSDRMFRRSNFEFCWPLWGMIDDHLGASAHAIDDDGSLAYKPENVDRVQNMQVRAGPWLPMAMGLMGSFALQEHFVSQLLIDAHRAPAISMRGAGDILLEWAWWWCFANPVAQRALLEDLMLAELRHVDLSQLENADIFDMARLMDGLLAVRNLVRRDDQLGAWTAEALTSIELLGPKLVREAMSRVAWNGHGHWIDRHGKNAPKVRQPGDRFALASLFEAALLWGDMHERQKASSYIECSLRPETHDEALRIMGLKNVEHLLFSF